MILAFLENDGISVLLIPSSYFPEHVASFGPLCHPGDFVLRAVRYQPSVLHMTEPQWLRDRTSLGQVFLCQGSVRVKVGGAVTLLQTTYIIYDCDLYYEQVQTLNH